MNTFNKKSLCVALAAFGAAGAAQAVNVSSDGIGQVLLYPYYTVRNGPDGNAYNTLISVVNTTGSAKAVKVRFIEGKNSKEVLDFNLYLSKYDVWTAAVVPTTNGAKLVVGETATGKKDTSCTLPNVVDGKEFVNFAYLADKGGTSLDRTREGYIEIIEMGTIYSGTTLEEAVTHVAGVPDDCSYVKNSTAGASSKEIGGVSGGLFGSATLISVLGGAMVGVDPTVLDNFATGSRLVTDSGSVEPNLGAADTFSVVIDSSNNVIESNWAQGFDPVSAVLMHDAVLNEYVTASSLNAYTNWVITMPTKSAYIGTGSGANSGKLFQSNFNSTVGSCDDVVVTLFDREENTLAEVDFSPPPPGGNALCWEANVVTFSGRNLLGSVNTANVDSPFGSGWAAIAIKPAAAGSNKHILISNNSYVNGSAASATYAGLPVIGFAATSYTNGTLANGVLSNYGAGSAHKLPKNIDYNYSLIP